MSERTPVTTYFLEMFQEPASPPVPAPVDTEVRRAALEAAEYRALYTLVGAPWLWYERSELPDSELAALIDEPEVSIYLLLHRGRTAGYVETKRTGEHEQQILYFGLAPGFIGAGLGRYFLDWTVRHAFATPTHRLWVHTCSLDHPRALATYLSVGFAEFRRESGLVRIPQSALERQRLAQTD